MIRILIIIIFIQFYSCAEGQKKITHNPQAVKLNLKALDYLLKSKYDTAILIFNQAIVLDPTFDLPHKNKFKIYFKQKDFNKALVESEALIKLDPNSTEWWLNSGMILDKTGDSIQAKQHYLSALKIIETNIHKQSHKANLGIHVLSKGIVLILLDEVENGRKIIHDLIAINPDNEHIKSFAKITKKEYLENVLDKQIYINEENNN